MSFLNTVRGRKAIVEYSVVQLIPLGVDKGRHQYMFPRCATGSEKPQRNIVFRFLTKSIVSERSVSDPRTISELERPANVQRTHGGLRDF